jgi:hypothetical protein
MKKLLLIALVAAGFLVAATPKSEARVFVNIGLGFPVGYYPYPAYYGGYPYGYPAYYPPPYVRFGYRPFYWWHGRRIYYARRCW